VQALRKPIAKHDRAYDRELAKAYAVVTNRSMGRWRVVTWNGKDVPPELRDLPMGHYVVRPLEIVHEVDDEDLDLDENEESARTESCAGS
jgi:hypothetical protein